MRSSGRGASREPARRRRAHKRSPREIERRAEREVRVEPPPRDETAELAVALARPGEERDAPDVAGELDPVDRPDARLLRTRARNGTTAYIPSVSVRARAGIPAAAAARARSSTGRVPASMEKFECTRR